MSWRFVLSESSGSTSESSLKHKLERRGLSEGKVWQDREKSPQRLIKNFLGKFLGKPRSTKTQEIFVLLVPFGGEN